LAAYSKGFLVMILRQAARNNRPSASAPTTIFDARKRPVSVRGTIRTDLLLGSMRADLFNGLAGDDRLFGYGGDDTLYGADGHDFLDGGAGHDRLFGGAGADTLMGGAGHDYLNGGDGHDYLYGHDGADTLLGGVGHDVLDGGQGDDYLAAGIGHNHVLGRSGNDRFLIEGSGHYSGDQGHDFFDVRSKGASLFGGNGIDHVSFQNLALGSDSPFIPNGVELNLARETATGSGREAQFLLVDFEHVTGTEGADSLTGNAANNKMWGGQGDDNFISSAGNDTFHGGDGNDTYIFLKSDIGLNHVIDYSAGHDQIIIETDEAYRLGSTSIKGNDLLIQFVAKDGGSLSPLRVINGAAAFKNGDLGIALSASIMNGPAQEDTWRAFAGTQNLAGAASMVGGDKADWIAVMNGFREAAQDTSMTGGLGGDHFVLNMNYNLVTVTDFKIKEGDRLYFEKSSGIHSFDHIEKNSRHQGNHLSVKATIDGFDVNYRFDNIKLSDLQEANRIGLISFSA
jgi:Ca2+-binding RTX toxin-like protein